MILTHSLFDVQWGNLLGVIILVSVLLLAVIGLALIIGKYRENNRTAVRTREYCCNFNVMISGLYWPIEIEPSWMQSGGKSLFRKRGRSWLY